MFNNVVDIFVVVLFVSKFCSDFFVCLISLFSRSYIICSRIIGIVVLFMVFDFFCDDNGSVILNSFCVSEYLFCMYMLDVVF